MSIILQATAIKIINKGGGSNTKTQQKKGFIRISTGEKKPGGMYVIFNCPGCNQRNKKEAHQSKYYREEDKILAFSCNGCMNVVEVKPPIVAPKLIV